ncbi:low molecular weight protein-tyrosine-phosphatase [Shewanella baltica]|uniref:low molecular weight protein-tyrosine-phosphatase n=1 Tax=Shewanella baltica TaxID=62322 RepID=UPI003D7A0E75
MKEARVQRILMVCMGNICRSPTAEAVCRFKVAERKLNIEVDSAGTIGYHQGDRPDSRAMAADKANLADLRSRCPLEYEYKLQLMLSYADTQVTEVPDPYYGGEQGFELVLDLLEQSMDALLDRLTSGPQK